MADKQVRVVISAQDSFSAVMQKYSAAMGKAAADTKKMDDAGKQADGGLTGLNNTMNNLMGVFAGIQILNVVGDMVSLGNAANATTATFTALSGGAEAAATTMRSLREATGGVVADTELMAGANRLLAMNIATTGQQAAELSAVAVNLGRAFGQDASTAIENFSLMIANQSLLRLDSLGISASAVRARMKELAAEFPNMDKQARFTQATLEQATLSVDRLGSSITAGQTPVAQLTTKFENFKTSIGQDLATTINSAITAIEQLEAISQVQFGHALPGQQQAILDNAKFFAEQWGATFGDWVGGIEKGMPSDFDPGDFLQRIEEARQVLGMDATNDQLVQKAGEDMWYSQAQIDHVKQVYDYLVNTAPVMEARDARMRQAETQLTEFRIAEAQRAQEGVDATYADAMYQIRFGGLEGMTSAQESEMKRFQAMMDSAVPADRKGQSNVDYAADKMFQFESNAGGIGKFLDPASLKDIEDRFKEIQELNERGLISDESLESAEELRSKAQEAADAFAKMSLTDIFGQSAGGIRGEISDMLMDSLKNSGMDEDKMADIQQTLDLSSGRETESSIAFNEQVLPMLHQLALQDPELAAQAIANFEEAGKQARLLGIDDMTMANNIMGFTGMGGSGAGSSFTVAPWGAGNAQGALAGNQAQYSPAMAAAFKEKYGIDLTPDTFAALQGMGGETQFNAEQIQPGIQNTMLDTAMQANTVNGFSRRTEEQILNDPAFQKAVQDATIATLAQLNAPAEAGGAGGMSTLSEISASTGIPVETLLSATGASRPGLVQPGTYNIPGYAPMQNYDPTGYAQGLAGGYAPQMGAGGGMGSPFMTNPILGMGAEAWGAAEGAAGSAEGATSPFDMAAAATDKIKDNTEDIATQVGNIALAADGVTKAFDNAAAPRTVQITVETIDKTNGLLKAVLGGLQAGSIQLGNASSVRDNGGRVAGQDSRVGQKPGFTK